MLKAFQRANRSPREVDYVECHATGKIIEHLSKAYQTMFFLGTAKGDPTETNWVGKEYGRSDQLMIGSVKGNVG